MVTGQYIHLFDTAAQFFGFVDSGQSKPPYRLTFQFPTQKEALSFSGCIHNGKDFQVVVEKNIANVMLLEWRK
jgi:hypothetical protein